MRFAGGCFALLLVLALSLSASASDPSFAFDVEEWRADWLGYSDDFQDGAFWDDNPSTEPAHYVASCGSVDDADEDDGRLRLQGADCVAAASASASSRGGSGSMRLHSQAKNLSGCASPSRTAQIPTSLVATHIGPTGESIRAYVMLVLTLRYYCS